MFLEDYKALRRETRDETYGQRIENDLNLFATHAVEVIDNNSHSKTLRGFTILPI